MSAPSESHQTLTRLLPLSISQDTDVIIRISGEPERAIAFEIFMTGEAKGIKSIARGIELFDQVIVCAPSPGALESLRMGLQSLSKGGFPAGWNAIREERVQ
jgi:hypothetical protein